MAADVRAQLVQLLPRLRRYAMALCHSPVSADDLVQGACVKVLANADSWVPGARFDGWVFRILRNHWVDLARKSKAEGTHEDISRKDNLLMEDGESKALDRIAVEEVRRLIGFLSPEQREVLLLICVEDMAYREAAEILGVPIGTVMSRLARARQRLLALVDAA